MVQRRNESKPELPPSLKIALQPVDRLFDQVAKKDVPDLWGKAIDNTCLSIGIDGEEAVRRLADPAHAPAVISELHAQSDVLVQARLYAQAEAARLSRQVQDYLNRPEARLNGKLQDKDRPLVVEAVRSAADFLTGAGKSSDADLDSAQRGVMHYHVSAYVFAQQQDARFKHVARTEHEPAANEVLLGRAAPPLRHRHSQP